MASEQLIIVWNGLVDEWNAKSTEKKGNETMSHMIGNYQHDVEVAKHAFACAQAHDEFAKPLIILIGRLCRGLSIEDRCYILTHPEYTDWYYFPELYPTYSGPSFIADVRSGKIKLPQRQPE